MKINHIAVYRYRLPFKKPVHLAGATVRFREGLLLHLKNINGCDGWGEAAPLPGFSRETLEEALQELLDLQPSLMGYDGDWKSFLPNRTLSSSVRFAVESALLDLDARVQDTIPARKLNPKAADRMPVNRLVTGMPDHVLEEIRAYPEPPPAIKLKVGGGHLGETAKLICAIRHLLPKTKLRLDANRSWTLNEASAFYELIHQVEIEYLEEPLRVPAELKFFCGRTGCPIALDETLRDIGPSGLHHYDFAVAIVVKPTLVGGMAASLAWAEAAHALSMRSVISAAYESGVGTLALAQLAASLPGLPEPAGLDTYRNLAGDVLTSPLQFEQDTLSLPSFGKEPGVGVSQLEKVI